MLSSSSYGVMLNKYKVVYLNDYQSALQLYLEQYFSVPNHERPHNALD